MIPRMNVRVAKDISPSVLATMRGMGERQVVVGVPEGANQRAQDLEGNYLNPIGNAGLYYLHDNGSALANIPQRETLRPGIEDAKEDIATALGNAAALAFKVPTAIDRGLEAAGLLATTAVRKRIIASEDLLELADATIAERRRHGIESSKPLIRTGQMLNSITYEVREKGAAS